jgi:hypothetical protein
MKRITIATLGLAASAAAVWLIACLVAIFAQLIGAHPDFRE